MSTRVFYTAIWLHHLFNFLFNTFFFLSSLACFRFNLLVPSFWKLTLYFGLDALICYLELYTSHNFLFLFDFLFHVIKLVKYLKYFIKLYKFKNISNILIYFCVCLSTVILWIHTALCWIFIGILLHLKTFWKTFSNVEPIL